MGKNQNHQKLIETACCICNILDLANMQQNCNDLRKRYMMRFAIRDAVHLYVTDGVDRLLERIASWDRAKLLSLEMDDWDAICDFHFEYEVACDE